MRISDWSSDVCSSDLFQPKVSARGCQMTGVETFLRWRGDDGKLKSPAAVLPVAEQHGLINELTKVIFHKAMAQQSAWRAEGHRFSIAVNVSLPDLTPYTFTQLVVPAPRNPTGDHTERRS